MNLAVWWPVSFKTVPVLALDLGLEARGSAAGPASSRFPVSASSGEGGARVA